MTKSTTTLFYCSLVALALFISSCSAMMGGDSNYGLFRTSNYVEDSAAASRNHLVLNDNTKIYGDKITKKYTTSHISINGQQYKFSEVKGFMENRTYMLRRNDNYIERIVHGKINVYVSYGSYVSSGTERGTMSFYYQIGEDGPLNFISSPKTIETLVKDCPAAKEMIAGKTGEELRKAERKDKNYLNEIIETYNYDCKRVIHAKKK